MRKRNKWLIFGGVAAFILGFAILQLWPRNQTNPPVRQEPEWDSARTRLLVQRACFDCHSNRTEWPWYAQIAPFSMLLEQDVEKGREVLNFSEWESSCCTSAEIDDMAETVNKGQMPLPYYLILHPEARLTDVEKGQLVNGLIATMSNETMNNEQ
jgi:hypothetical protein